MRQVGTLPDVEKARAFAGYLASKSLETKLEQTPEGWAVWLFDEDRVSWAREEFQAFQTDPTAERFRNAPRLAIPEQRPAAPTPSVLTAPRSRGVAPRHVTITLIALSVVVSLLLPTPQQGQAITESFFLTRVVNLGEGQFRYRAGLPEIESGQLWRVVTPIFIHFSPWHLLFNMLAMVSIGLTLEMRVGSWRMLLLVLLLAVLSNLAQYYLGQVRLEGLKPVVEEWNPIFGGMSGVIFGLFGFVWIWGVYDASSGMRLSPGTVVFMIFWLLLCMTGAVGPIANAAHLGGLAVGMIVGYVIAWWNHFGVREE